MAQTQNNKAKCFVISPIGVEGSDVRRHADEALAHIIKPVMEACNIEAIRSDHLQDPGRRTEQMLEHIISDELCIAVLSGYNPSVFYELVIAQFAQRPVIIMLEKGQELPFDVKDLRCVYYDLWPTPIVNGTYMRDLIAQVRALEERNWNVPPLSKEIAEIIKRMQESETLDFFMKLQESLVRIRIGWIF
jgi:hypothetical protein